MKRAGWLSAAVAAIGLVACGLLFQLAVPPLQVQAASPPGPQPSSWPGCNAVAIYSSNANGATQMIALKADQAIYVCGYKLLAGGTVNVKLVQGTGTNCGTGTSDLTPLWPFTAQAGISDSSATWRGMKTTAGRALCLNSSAAVTVAGEVYYAQW